MSEAQAGGVAKAIRSVAELHGPVSTTLVGLRVDDAAFQDIDPDSFEEIVSRNTVCMACQGYPTHPCATYAAAAEALTATDAS